MDLKQIEKLMAAMERSSMKRIVLKKEGFEIELERECGAEAHVVMATPPSMTEMPRGVEQGSPQHLPHREHKQEEALSGEFVTSPMVGTFYSSPSPDDPPFVKVGESVEPDTVLCIIEAMKVMNEVKAGIKGKVVEVLAENGDPVEFGSNIFRIEP